MSLGYCRVCTKPLKLGGRICARCGFKRHRINYIMASLVLIQVVGLIFYAMTDRKTMRYVGSAQAASQVPPLDGGPNAGWVYYETVDKLVYDVTKHARVLSHGDLAAGKREDNGTTGVLELRASPTYGRSVLVTLKRAAFDTVDQTCTLHAQFDADPATDFSAACSTAMT